MFKLVHRSFRTTFAVRQEHLRMLIRELPEFEHLEIRAKCVDKERVFSSIEELFEFKNLSREAIQALEIASWSSAEHFSLVRLENDYSSNVQVFFNGKPETANALLQTAQDFIEVASPWYKVVTNNRLLALFLSFFFLLYAILVGGSLLFKTELVTSVLSRSWWPLGAGSILGVSLMVGFAYFFPAGSFAIGDGERRYQTKEVFRVGVVLSTAASVTSAFVVKLLGA